MNFNRGKQIVIHDPRLDDGQSPPKPLNPPQSSVLTWTVNRGDTLSNILGSAADLADASGKLDAVHIMAHGNKAFVQLGADNISWSNVDQFTKLNGKARCIVIFSCLVGGDESRDNSHSALGGAIAVLTEAKVLVCKEVQWYGWSSNNRTIDFGNFDGEVYLYYPDGSHNVVFKNTTSGNAQINLEPYIFRN
jgi:hypothetical protein